MNRRMFVITAGAAVPSAILSKQRWADDKPLTIADELVGEFVRKSHFNFDAIRSMLKSEPQLVNSCWDWGKGDFETGLGGAAHMGRRNIAELLLEHGARLDVFAATMLGMSGVVRAVLEAMPNIHSVRGPHGIPLLSHAVAGGDQSFELVEFLIKRGATVNTQSNNGTTPLMQAAAAGHVDAVKLLLERGADRNLRDAKGNRAIDRAKKRDRAAVVSLLSA